MIQYTVKRILLMESYLTNTGAASVFSLTDSNHPTIVTVNIFFPTATTGDRESCIIPFVQMRKLNIVVTSVFVKVTYLQTFMPLLLESLCSALLSLL